MTNVNRKNLILTATGNTIEVTTHHYTPRKQTGILTVSKLDENGDVVFTCISLSDENRRSLIKMLSGKDGAL